MASLHKTVYLVLRHTPFQESSLVVSGITPDLGKLNFLVKGARRTGKKSFPKIGLFRELEIEFRMPGEDCSLLTMHRMELLREFDRLALHTGNYLAACDHAAFLLGALGPMLGAEQSYTSMKVLLEHLCDSEEPEPWLTLARLAFLSEAGLLPEPEGEREAALLDRLLAAAQGTAEMPELSAEYINKLAGWVKRLLRHHGLR